jgi:carbohydrate-selective porin OprB
VGLNLEQAIGDSLGVFVRGMYSDGQTEVYAYMPADRSLSFGALARGTWWKRPRDLLGAAFGASWISRAHADYLGRGGVDGFIGDGRITQAAETTFELVYSVRVLDPLWLSADYQHVIHPAYNADRGPVDIGGARLHVEL